MSTQESGAKPHLPLDLMPGPVQRFFRDLHSLVVKEGLENALLTMPKAESMVVRANNHKQAPFIILIGESERFWAAPNRRTLFNKKRQMKPLKPSLLGHDLGPIATRPPFEWSKNIQWSLQDKEHNAPTKALVSLYCWAWTVFKGDSIEIELPSQSNVIKALRLLKESDKYKMLTSEGNESNKRPDILGIQLYQQESAPKDLRIATNEAGAANNDMDIGEPTEVAQHAIFRQNKIEEKVSKLPLTNTDANLDELISCKYTHGPNFVSDGFLVGTDFARDDGPYDIWLFFEYVGSDPKMRYFEFPSFGPMRWIPCEPQYQTWRELEVQRKFLFSGNFARTLSFAEVEAIAKMLLLAAEEAKLVELRKKSLAFEPELLAALRRCVRRDSRHRINHLDR